MKTIVVGYDESEPAKRALARAAETKDLDIRADGVEVTLLWAMGLRRAWGAVRNHCSGEECEVEIRGLDYPLDVFRYPYAYACRAHAGSARRSMSAAAPYPSLGGLRVIDAMHPALITCPPDSSLRTIARMMATYRVHAILVTAHGKDELPGGGRWGIVSDVDLLRAGEESDVDEVQAHTVAAQPVAAVASTEPLRRAAALMVERDVSHVIVIESRSGRPIGVLSTLDVARALAGFPEQHPIH